MPGDAILDDNAHFVAVRGIVLFTSEVIGSVTGCENAADGLRSCTSSEAFRFGRGWNVYIFGSAFSTQSNRKCLSQPTMHG